MFEIDLVLCELCGEPMDIADDWVYNGVKDLYYKPTSCGHCDLKDEFELMEQMGYLLENK